jgi:hypothetical protein
VLPLTNGIKAQIIATPETQEVAVLSSISSATKGSLLVAVKQNLETASNEAS